MSDTLPIIPVGMGSCLSRMARFHIVQCETKSTNKTMLKKIYFAGNICFKVHLPSGLFAADYCQ